jgi:hypothetical protein
MGLNYMKKGFSYILIIIATFIICAAAITITYMIVQPKNSIFGFKNNSTVNENDTENTDETESNEKMVTLQQVADKVKNCKTIKSYIDSGMNVVVEVKGNILNLKVGETNYEYTLENSILSAQISKDDLNGAIILMSIIDSVGQLHGYEDGALFSTLNSDAVKNYKLKDGFEMIESENSITCKIDINKKIVLADFSNVYIQVSDLQDGIEFLKDGGSYQTSKGNLIFYKSGYDNEVIITIGEKTKLSDNAYKSLLSSIEIIFDKAEADNFARQYTSLINKTFGKYNLEIEPILSSMEKVVFGNTDCEIVRLTIDKSK